MGKLVLVMGNRKIRLKQPEEGVAKVEVPKEVCPHCKENLVVAGGGKRIKNHDTYAAPAVCLACNHWVGELELKVSTLFGLEEDERVFSMGFKIY
jgi:hypothetical protein